jgi:hypothetical protein
MAEFTGKLTIDASALKQAMTFYHPPSQRTILTVSEEGVFSWNKDADALIEQMIAARNNLPIAHILKRLRAWDRIYNRAGDEHF